MVRESEAADERTLDEVVRDAMAEWQIPGVTVAVLHDGKVETHGYGVISLETNYPTRPDTLFQVGSNSKVFTATLVMRLVEAGLLDLDTPVGDYLPDLRLSDPGAANTITLRHLLSHTSGLEGDRFEDTGEGDDAVARYVAGAGDWVQNTAPGEFWSYCNSGFGLAGRIVEVAAGTTFEAAMKERVFVPLGLERSFYFAHEAIVYSAAAGQTQLPGEDAPHVARPYHIGRRAHPAGGIIASAGDFAYLSPLSHGGWRGEWGARPRAGVDPRHAGAAGRDRRRAGLGDRLVFAHHRRRTRHRARWRHERAHHQMLAVPEQTFGLVILTNGNRGGMSLNWSRNGRWRGIAGCAHASRSRSRCRGTARAPDRNLHSADGDGDRCPARRRADHDGDRKQPVLGRNRRVPADSPRPVERVGGHRDRRRLGGEPVAVHPRRRWPAPFPAPRGTAGSAAAGPGVAVSLGGDTPSPQDRDGREDPFGQVEIPAGVRRLPRLMEVDALREEPPSDLLTDHDSGRCPERRGGPQPPTVLLPQRDPLASGIAGDGQPQRGPRGSGNVGQGARPAHARTSSARGRTTPVLSAPNADRVANVLLMHPAFGVLAGDVEPDGRRLRTRPVDRHPERGHVQAGEVRLGKLAGHRQQLDQQLRADPPRPGHPDRVLAIDGGDETGQRRDVETGGERRVDIAIAPPGEAADVVTQQVRRHVLHRPAGTDGGGLPVRGREAAQELQQSSPLPRKEAQGVDGSERIDRPSP